MERFHVQAERFGAEIVTAKVSRVDLGSPPFGVWTGDPGRAAPATGCDR